MNKRKIMAAALCLNLAAGFSAMAAVPEGGVLLNKEGAPIEEEMTKGPQIASNAMPEKSAEVLNGMKQLEHSSSSVISFTAGIDGHVTDAAVAQSSGIAVLDQYALDAVKGWTMKPAENNGQPVPVKVTVPIRFVSMKVSTPAAPKDQPETDKSDVVKRIITAHPDGAISVKVTLYVDAGGKAMEVNALTPEYDFLTEEENEAAAAYAEKWVSAWTFRPAQNADGQSIGSDEVLVVQLV